MTLRRAHASSTKLQLSERTVERLAQTWVLALVQLSSFENTWFAIVGCRTTIAFAWRPESSWRHVKPCGSEDGKSVVDAMMQWTFIHCIWNMHTIVCIYIHLTSFNIKFGTHEPLGNLSTRMELAWCTRLMTAVASQRRLQNKNRQLVKRCKATLLKCAAKVVSPLVQVPDFMGQHVKAADKDIKVAANY